MRVITILTGIFAIGLISSNALAEDWVYKWVDADGAEMTNVKVKRTEAQTVQKRQNRAEDMQAAVETREQQEAEGSAEQQQWNEDVATQRAANCKTAQERVNAYNTAHRLYRELGDGEREYLDDDQTDSARADAHNLVNEWCDNS